MSSLKPIDIQLYVYWKLCENVKKMRENSEVWLWLCEEYAW